MYLYVYKNQELIQTVLIDEKHIFDIGDTLTSSMHKYGDDCMIVVSQQSKTDPLREELVES